MVFQTVYRISTITTIIAITLYLFTLAPSVVTLFDDSLEFQLVTHQLGIAHPTGYPLYTILGKLFTIIPIGNVAFRVNLMSAVFGAITIGLVTAIIIMIGRHIYTQTSIWQIYLGGVVGGLALTISPIFWQQATIAEVYTLNSFFISLIVLIAILPNDKNQQKLHYKSYLLATLFGLSLTHHRTMILLLPAVTFYLLYQYKNKHQFYPSPFIPYLLSLTVLFLLPLSLYLYLPLRGHIGSLDGTYQNSWAGFWQQVTASGYGSTFLFGNPFGQERTIGFYIDLLKQQFAWLTILGCLGIAILILYKQTAWLILTTTTFLSYTLFNLFYNVADIEVFFIPVFMIWAVWMGIGLLGLFHWLNQLCPPGARWLLMGVITGLILLQVAIMIQQNWQPLLARNQWTVHDYGLDILKQPLPENATIIGIVGEMTLLRYFQQTEGLRPDIETIAADKETARFEAIETAVANGRAVYLTRELPEAAQQYHLHATGPLIAVNRSPLTNVATFDQAHHQPITPEINYIDFKLSRRPHTGSGVAPVRLTVAWQATKPISTNLKVSARLLDGAGTVVAVVDTIPVHFAYPTTAWRTGETITDVYDLLVPSDLPPDHYQPLLIWYDPAQGALEVGRLEIDPIWIQ